MSSPSVLTNGTTNRDPIPTPEGSGAELGLVVMDSSFKMLAFDRGAAAILNDLDAGTQHLPGWSIPAEIRKAILDARPGSLVNFKLHFRRGGHGYKCRLFAVKPLDASLPGELLVLHFERDWSPADSLGELSAAYQLTSREHEVLIGIAMGLSGKELADRMEISPGTVKSFIRMIMAKLGVKTRGAILAKLLEYNGSKDRCD